MRVEKEFLAVEVFSILCIASSQGPFLQRKQNFI